jgi:hypothetical protein
MANFAVLAQIDIDLARFKPKSYLTSDLDDLGLNLARSMSI